MNLTDILKQIGKWLSDDNSSTDNSQSFTSTTIQSNIQTGDFNIDNSQHDGFDLRNANIHELNIHATPTAEPTQPSHEGDEQSLNTKNRHDKLTTLTRIIGAALLIFSAGLTILIPISKSTDVIYFLTAKSSLFVLITVIFTTCYNIIFAIYTYSTVKKANNKLSRWHYNIIIVIDLLTVILAVLQFDTLKSMPLTDMEHATIQIIVLFSALFSNSLSIPSLVEDIAFRKGALIYWKDKQKYFLSYLRIILLTIPSIIYLILTSLSTIIPR